MPDAAPKCVIFLGAGASKADGAPIQGELFQSFMNRESRTPREAKIRRELLAFFTGVFGTEEAAFAPGPTGAMASPAPALPTAEEALGILDLAQMRGESLVVQSTGGGAGSAAGATSAASERTVLGPQELRTLRGYLVLAMAAAIDDALQEQNSYHQQLVQHLQADGLLASTSFISTNYDTMIDNALSRLGEGSRSAPPSWAIDYGVDFENLRQRDVWRLPVASCVPLLKIHGSLNWLYCPCCNTLTLTQYKKRVRRVMNETRSTRCGACRTMMQPVIVPPTFYKDLSKAFLQAVWNRAEQVLREAQLVVFCGYSFPAADMHVKYLLKRAQLNRRSPVTYIVANNHASKAPEEKAAERSRYERFFGREVLYSELSFQEFAAQPATAFALASRPDVDSNHQPSLKESPLC
jgi:NAD-dependent SIR2 family protein deacetylase